MSGRMWDGRRGLSVARDTEGVGLKSADRRETVAARRTMKILFATHRFYPEVGGLETVSLILAEEFAAAGHEVRLVTHAVADAGTDDTQFPFPVFRRPGTGGDARAAASGATFTSRTTSACGPCGRCCSCGGRGCPRTTPGSRGSAAGSGGRTGSRNFCCAVGTRVPIAVSHEVARSLEVPGDHRDRQPVQAGVVPPPAGGAAHARPRVPGAAGVGQGRGSAAGRAGGFEGARDSRRS